MKYNGATSVGTLAAVIGGLYVGDASDQEKFLRFFWGPISRIVVEAMESCDMKFPEPTVDIGEIKRKYHAIVEEDEKEKKNRKAPAQ